MKVEILKFVSHKSQNYNIGEIVELPNAEALVFISKGIAREVKKKVVRKTKVETTRKTKGNGRAKTNK